MYFSGKAGCVSWNGSQLCPIEAVSCFCGCALALRCAAVRCGGVRVCHKCGQVKHAKGTSRFKSTPRRSCGSKTRRPHTVVGSWLELKTAIPVLLPTPIENSSGLNLFLSLLRKAQLKNIEKVCPSGKLGWKSTLISNWKINLPN